MQSMLAYLSWAFCVVTMQIETLWIRDKFLRFTNAGLVSKPIVRFTGLVAHR